VWVAWAQNWPEWEWWEKGIFLSFFPFLGIAGIEVLDPCFGLGLMKNESGPYRM
jgi:hypothetical protein